MKVSMQTIINVCFAISLTALIYQNNQLQKSLNASTKELISSVQHNQTQLDVFRETYLSINGNVSDNFESLDVITQNQEMIHGELKKNRELVLKHDDELRTVNTNLDILAENRKLNTTKIENIEKWIVDNFN